MPYKKVEVGVTDETKEYMDNLVKRGIYKNPNTLASTAVRKLIEGRKDALSIREKAFPK